MLSPSGGRLRRTYVQLPAQLGSDQGLAQGCARVPLLRLRRRAQLRQHLLGLRALHQRPQRALALLGRPARQQPPAATRGSASGSALQGAAPASAPPALGIRWKPCPALASPAHHSLRLWQRLLRLGHVACSPPVHAPGQPQHTSLIVVLLCRPDTEAQKSRSRPAQWSLKTQGESVATHLGDSGRNSIPTAWSRAGTAATPSIHLRPSCALIKCDMQRARCRKAHWSLNLLDKGTALLPSITWLHSQAWQEMFTSRFQGQM